MNTKLYETKLKSVTAELNDLRLETLTSVIATRDKLADQITEDAQRSQLLGIIDEVLQLCSNDTKQNAPLTVQQFLGGSQVSHPDALAGDGGVILSILIDGCRFYDNAKRRQVFEAVLLCAVGASPAGLITYPDDWQSTLPVSTLQQFALVLDEPATTKFAETLAALRGKHADASRIADRLSNPVTITPTLTEPEAPEQELIAVTNHDEGTPHKIAGVSLPGYGRVTHVTREKLNEMRESPVFQACANVGALEVHDV
ncbi:MAG: hypothetical protein KZQ73_05610 [Candidatus Thiodiazotropha sp. (ex Semelilucina semeliformis)]|nr:hypothetical protein [Candidatus Thiodiazotropha sp. (ex Semelilucina semeliformis)]